MRNAVIFILLLGCIACQEDYTDKMSKEHKGDKPVAAPITKEDNRVDVVTKDIVYATIDGKKITGYLAHPKGKSSGIPGVIVIQEWWGLNDNIKTMARKVAAEGYIALAVDMYGEIATTSQDARKLMKKAMGNQEQAEANLQQAHAYLHDKHQVSKIGSIGWCFGGHWSLRCGLLFENKIDAVVIYYGRLVKDPQKLAKLQAPILGIFGELDRGIPVEGVREFEKLLKTQEKQIAVHVYPKANHAFANPSGTRYDEKAAADAWQKTLAFFAKNLQGK